jgi:hypothetical protein
MTTQHTPGPWAASRDASVIFKGYATLAHIEPAFDPETDSDTPDVTAANARLIAAAPELLAMLRSVSEFMPGEGMDHAMLESIKALVAKAEGLA